MKHELARLGVQGGLDPRRGHTHRPRLYGGEGPAGSFDGPTVSMDTSPVILLMAGWSFRVSAVERMIERLGVVDRPFQLVVLSRPEQESFMRGSGRKQRGERRIAAVYEFIDFVENLMRLGDILISKPGGITTAESLAAGLPMIAVDPIPGQEEANSDYILEAGAGLKARSLDGLLFQGRPSPCRAGRRRP